MLSIIFTFANHIIMQRIHLGELEELILLIVAKLYGDAYGISVKQELEDQTGRAVNISAIHAALRRLEDKKFVTSAWSEATAERGGRRKRLFSITDEGKVALEHVMETRLKIWNQIPGFDTKTSLS